MFFCSGAAGLICQVAWQRLLTLHYGVGAVSTALIVSVYMLGPGIGSFLGGILAERVRDRVRLYFGVELALGLFGQASYRFMDLIGRWTAGCDYAVSLLWMTCPLAVPTVKEGMGRMCWASDDPHAVFPGTTTDPGTSTSQFAVLVSTNGGAIWRGWFAGTNSSGLCSDVAVVPSGSNIVCAVGYNLWTGSPAKTTDAV